ncbi:hypothetical protein [Nitrospirillum iridis]|uniref:TnsA endonuclease N-terminal domain-containing protein n=1 Tax=Nitrospirillum iridis TaxID=765888 RepID=A0A7X0AWN4_9PROT|nr:hypothetical protein [Nitrospirillum iridis]MBB6251468.1 hypothetical protein [Nitrospirillum iridis]
MTKERVIARHLHALRRRRRQGANPTTSIDITDVPAPAQQPLADDASAHGPPPDDVHCHDAWQPPAESTGSRQPPARSKGHCRAWIVDPADNRVLGCESALELALANILLADRRVVRVEDQPPRVGFIRPDDGRLAHHTFDFRVTLDDGRRVAIAVKPEGRLRSSRIHATVAAIRQQAPWFADSFQVATERHATPRRAANATAILRARRMRCEGDVATMRAMVAGLREEVRLGDLRSWSNLGARAWAAILNLIDDGVLELVAGSIVGQDARVRLRDAPVAARDASHQSNPPGADAPERHPAQAVSTPARI